MIVVGAGLAGSAVAIRLASAGVAVTVIERNDRGSAIGSGISLQGNAVRVLHQLGVWDALREQVWEFDGVRLRAPDAEGTVLAEITDVRLGGPLFAAGAGTRRPVLAAALHDRAESVGAHLRFGVGVERLVQDGSGVTVSLSDGTTVRADLVIGADGIRSTVRSMIGVDVTARPMSMGIWRIAGPRPAEVDRTELYYGGPCHIAGYCPTGPDSMYAYLVVDAHDAEVPQGRDVVGVVAGLAARYPGPWRSIAAELADPSAVNYTRFESLLLEGAWHRGRVVLIGDAVHACPPTIAQGGAQALEDATVLADLLLTEPVCDATFEAFADRRMPRVRAVVESSVRIAEWTRDRDADADVAGLMSRVSRVLMEPA